MDNRQQSSPFEGMSFWRNISTVGLLLFATNQTMAAVPTHWQLRHPNPIAEGIGRVSFVGNRFIAVGSAGKLIVSTDGESWAQADSGTLADLTGAAYGAGRYVVVGAYGTVLSSEDAFTWSNQFAGTFSTLTAIAYGNGRFVATGYGQVLISLDGINWSSTDSGFGSFLDVVFTGTNFVGVTANAILTSSDGIRWQIRNRTGGYRVTADGETIVVLQYDYQTEDTRTIMSTSDDGGMNWTLRLPLQFYARDLCKFRYDWIAPSQSTTIMSSIDLEHWTPHRLPGPVDVVAASTERITAIDFRGDILTSADLHNWTNHTFIADGPLRSLAFGHSGYVAIAPQEIWTAADGAAWDVTTITNALLTSVAYGNGLYLMTGYRIDSDSLLYPLLLSSSDAKRWATQEVTFDGQAQFTDGRFFVLGFRHISHSMDGQSWTSVTMGNYLRSLAYGNGVYLAADYGDCQIRWSQDLTNWPRVDIPDCVRDIVFGNGVFVAVCEPQSTWVSTNGTNWAVSQLPIDGQIERIRFEAGIFFAIIDSYVLTSSNGVNWDVNFKADHWLRDIVFGNGTFLAVGDYAVYQSSRIDTAAPAIFRHPLTQVWTNGDTAQFTVFAGGTQPLIYQWFKDGVLTSQTSTPDLRLTNLRVQDAGAYWVVVTNLFGVATSRVARLYVEQVAPVISLGGYNRLTISGIVGRTYCIETAENIETNSWRIAAEFTLLNTPYSWIDPDPPSMKRFYRARLLR